MRSFVQRKPTSSTTPSISSERDSFAESHRALGEHDESADEIVDKRLAAETDADRESTTEDREGGERHTDRVQRRERDKHQQAVEDQRANGGGGIFAQAESLQKAIGEHAGCRTRHHPTDDEYRQAFDGLADRDRTAR